MYLCEYLTVSWIIKRYFIATCTLQFLAVRGGGGGVLCVGFDETEGMLYSRES